MSRFLAAVVVLAASGLLRAADPTVIDTMDELRFTPSGNKGRAEVVEGKVGKAVRFSFEKDCASVFFMRRTHAPAEWDKAAGISFWVKGDGSDHFGGLQFIYDDNFALRYDFMFPIKSREWKKVTVAWRDLVPVLPAPGSQLLNPDGGNKPSKTSALWFGKWWYWRDYAAHSYTIDDLRLERTIERDDTDYQPAGPPLARVLEKLKARKPITIVTMGDSLTDYNHWANRQVAWPKLLREGLREKYGSETTIVNPAIGGTQLRQNLVLMPRWLALVPEPDLVTICFGGNDWESGMRGPVFEETCKDAVDRIRRATKGKADVLILSTVPNVVQWTTMAELAEACRKAARARNAGLADIEAAFHKAGRENREHLYASDHVHLGPAGHELTAQTVLDAIAADRR